MRIEMRKVGFFRAIAGWLKSFLRVPMVLVLPLILMTIKPIIYFLWNVTVMLFYLILHILYVYYCISLKLISLVISLGYAIFGRQPTLKP